jgi:hemerythrin-like domain-containing protein
VIAQLRTVPTAALLERLCGLLAQHIRLEENEVFQLAQARLAAPVLRELGRAIQSKVVLICI